MHIVLLLAALVVAVLLAPVVILYSPVVVITSMIIWAYGRRAIKPALAFATVVTVAETWWIVEASSHPSYTSAATVQGSVALIACAILVLRQQGRRRRRKARDDARTTARPSGTTHKPSTQLPVTPRPGPPTRRTSRDNHQQVDSIARKINNLRG